MLPLLRVSHIRARDAHVHESAKRSIILCVPAKDSVAGMPFAAAQAMSAAATIRGAEVLRNEIRAVSTSNDDAESMKDLKVTIVDVGYVGAPASITEMRSTETMEKSMLDWTTTQRSVYGDAFIQSLKPVDEDALRGDPESVERFVQTVVDHVNGPKRIDLHHHRLMHALQVLAFNLRTWLRGERFAVGATQSESTILCSFLFRNFLTFFFGLPGYTTSLTSLLPDFIVDKLPNVQSYLTSIRNRFFPLPVAPRLPPVTTQPPPAPTAPPAKITTRAPKKESMQELVYPGVNHIDIDNIEPTLSDTELELSGASSEAEIEIESSNGYTSGMGSSWVSLRDNDE